MQWQLSAGLCNLLRSVYPRELGSNLLFRINAKTALCSFRAEIRGAQSQQRRDYRRWSNSTVLQRKKKKTKPQDLSAPVGLRGAWSHHQRNHRLFDSCCVQGKKASHGVCKQTGLQQTNNWLPHQHLLLAETRSRPPAAVLPAWFRKKERCHTFAR